MQGSESMLGHFFKQSYLEIPLYQRNYDWKLENCEQLFEDIIDVYKLSENPERRHRKHFFGSIIYMIDQDTAAQVIIDGQQRITTTALLLAAIRDCVIDGLIISTDPKLPDKLDRKLKDQDNGKIFLSPVEKDRAPYNAVINREKEDYDKTSNVTVNYDYFKERLRALRKITIDEFIEGVEKLYVMVVRLNSNEDDAQMVFESINSTGLNLNEGDKIRNYLLMKHDVKEQKIYYEKYWRRIDDGSFDLSRFFRDYLTAISGQIPKRDKTYLEFKKHTRDLDSVESFEEIVRYAGHYRSIVNGDLNYISKKASVLMYHINVQNATVSYPFIMRVLDANKGSPDLLSNKDVENILAILENYLLRRSICKIPTNALNSIFQNLFNNLTKKHGSDGFADRLKYSLLTKEGSSRYPLDKEVMTNLAEMDIYYSGVCPYVLSVVENANRDAGDTLMRVHGGELSVEHVMPQKKSDAWRKEIGDDYDEVHERWLHRLGNLTLTAYNSEYSNRPYSEKRGLKDHGFMESGLRLNGMMKNNEHWTEAVINERNEKMAEDFIRFMPEFSTTYVPPPEEVRGASEYTLEEDEGFFIGMKIRGYVFNGKRHEASNGVKVFVSLLREIYKIDPTKFMVIERKKGRGQLGLWLLSDLKDTKNKHQYEQIGPDIWVYRESDNSGKAWFLKGIMSLYDIDLKDVALIGTKDKGAEQDEE